MKTSLGIWAFGAMATRFNPGGYKPELVGASTADKVRTAVEGLGDLMDDYEFHYPQELSRDNLDAVREALDGHGIYAVATGTHLNPRYGKGGLSSPDDAVRGAALAEALDVAAFAGEIGSHDDPLAGRRGLQLPVPDAVRRLVGALHRRRRPGRDPLRRERHRRSSSSTRTPSPR